MKTRIIIKQRYMCVDMDRQQSITSRTPPSPAPPRGNKKNGRSYARQEPVCSTQLLWGANAVTAALAPMVRAPLDAHTQPGQARTQALLCDAEPPPKQNLPACLLAPAW